jgi:uncharacterized protein (DUF169 family)
MQNNYAEILTASLQLRQAPVAISFTDAIPAGLGRPEERVAAGCRFWQDAAGKTFATAASDHGLCAIGIHTHNLTPTAASMTDLRDALRVFGDLGYVREEDIAAIPVLRDRPGYVIYGPLEDARVAPDVVLLFVDSRQMLVLSEASQQVENGNPPAMGRPACAVVPQVMNTGRAAVSLGCCGARAYLDVFSDDVAIFAIPGAKLEAYVQRIKVLSEANSVLAKFHTIRRHQIEAGGAPTIKDSLAAMA